MSCIDKWTSKNIWSKVKINSSNWLIIKNKLTESYIRKIWFKNIRIIICMISYSSSKSHNQGLIFYPITKTRRHILTINTIIISNKLFFEWLCFEIYNTTRTKSHGRCHQNTNHHKHNKHFKKSKPFLHDNGQNKMTYVYVVIIEIVSTKNC